MIRLISAAETLPVRCPILRPGFPRETAIFAGDDDAPTQHFGAFLGDGRLVGVASIYRVPLPTEDGTTSDWQLRGMATTEDARGTGYGRELLLACEAAAQAAGGERIWCNARVSASGFYSRHGWQILGKEFDIPTVGPHFRMWKSLDT